MRTHHPTNRHRPTRTWLPAALAGVGALLSARGASAQAIDAAPPLPDVLLLVDTSGSMELMMDGCNTDTGLYTDGSGGGCCSNTIPCVSSSCSSSCASTSKVTYCDGVTARSPNRWATEVAALTGSYLNSAESGTAYSCLSMPRSTGSAFASEFSYQYSSSGAKANPYDLNYYYNFHRPVENINSTTACAYGFVQGSTGWNASDSSGSGTSHQENPSSGSPDFAAASIGGYQYSLSTLAPVSSTTQTACTFNQANNGLINQNLNAMRFALMTIDSDTAPNSGVNVTADSGNLTFTDVANLGGTSNVSTGMWSYYNGWESPGSGTPPPYTGASIGRPAGCGETASSGLIYYEVGARNPAAPPWEGRMMRFPSSAAPSPAANNQNIMQAIRVMRPYGANPIAGMLDDAKYYYWQDPQGPAYADPYVSCRPQYIILFSHAAPNEDLEPYCQGGSGSTVGICPYDYPEYISGGLASGTYSQHAGVVNSQSATASGAKIKTFVVGFSLESTLGDAGEAASCSQILSGTYPNQTVNPAYCGTQALNGADSGTAGNPAYASCCALARIAVNGGTNAPYFADNATDLASALAAIESIILSTATTRATPVLLPQSVSAVNTPALFVSSFSPNSTSWSGDVQRERYTCPESSSQPYQNVTPSAGDDFAYNLDNAGSQTRNVIMVEPSLPSSGSRNASTTIRPWVRGTGTTAYDNYSMYDGTEWGYSYTTTGHTVTTLSSSFASSPTVTSGITSDVLFPSGCSYTQPGMSLTTSDCEQIALGWLLGMQSPPSDWKTTITPFPNRYYTGAPASPSPMGGVYHSTPAIAAPPSALLRDDSYQAFSSYYSTSYATYPGSGSEPRHTVLFTATTDGLLHAFGVDYNSKDPYTFIGTSHGNEGGTTQTQNEMWSFVPPAVMPLLMNSVGGGSTVLLDGAPVVKDTVYQRSSVGAGSDWHTSLVAGFGSAMGGYYALDVTDPSFANRGATPNTFATSTAIHQSANSNTPPSYSSGTGYMGAAASPGAGTPPGNTMPMGPHFLWQLMDSNLFASSGGTPAIATVSINDPDSSSQPGPVIDVGVAILPGGAATPYGGACPRVACPTGVASCSSTSSKISDASPSGYPLGTDVRQWTSSGCPSTALNSNGTTINPASGRSLTVVRLDTGEVLRTFTTLTDVPSTFALYGSGTSFSTTCTSSTASSTCTKLAHQYATRGRVTQADFDSPISGTPVPYPADVGAIAQRVFVGDEDGTIWRLDVSDTNMNNWFVEPFFDSYNTTVQTGTAASAAAQRAPIVLAPTVSIGRDGNVVLNFGTGDTNFIGTATNQNYVYSITELPNASAQRLLANLNWYLTLPNAGEMITGPATVFSDSYYFATYRPPSSANSCNTGASAYIWGMDFTLPTDNTGKAETGSSTVVNKGGVWALTSSSGNVQNVTAGNAIVPGVTVTATEACGTPTATTDPATGGPLISMSGATPPTYELSALQGAGGGTSSTGAAVSQVNIAITVHASTLIDSWAAIVE